jgi:hypothetical protein
MSIPAAIITETDTRINPPANPEQHCHDSGGPSSHCEVEFLDPATGRLYRAQAVAQASYGFLSVESHLDPPSYWSSSWSSASFSDTITVFGSNRIAFLVPIWDATCTEHSDVHSIDCTIGPVPGNVLELSAHLFAGDPFSILPSVTGSLRLLSIRILDQELEPLTGLYYRSQSGASYNVEGAVQVPEPGYASRVIVVCLLFVWRRWVVS